MRVIEGYAQLRAKPVWQIFLLRGKKMELGKNLGRIVDYGTTKTKAGSLQVFIKFQIGAEESTWYGVPYKKDSDEVNDMCLMQLTYCGFDPSKNELEELSGGLDSNILITDEDIDLVIADQITPNGDTARRIKSIGEFGPTRITAEESKTLVSEAKKQKLKEAASKFKVRKKVEKEDPTLETPF